MSQQRNPAWVLTDSSAIEALAYDEGTQSLFVRFRPSHAEYCYENVTRAEHAALTTAGSIGSHFNAQIKKTHPYRKLSSDGEN